jgi:hypothetical protein
MTFAFWVPSKSVAGVHVPPAPTSFSSIFSCSDSQPPAEVLFVSSIAALNVCVLGLPSRSTLKKLVAAVEPQRPVQVTERFESAVTMPARALL